MVFLAAGLRRSRKLAVVSLISLLVASAGASYLLARDRASVLEATVTAQGNMALGLEREILRNLDIYDLSLRAAASGMRLLDASMDASAQNAILFDGSTAARHFRPILIANGLGAVSHDGGAASPRVASLADRPFFAAHRDRADLGLLLQLYPRGGISREPYLSLSRRVSGADGTFEGTVSGGLSLDYFNEIFSRFTLARGGAIALVGYDGRLVAGFPFREGMAGRDVTAGGLVEVARGADFTTFETTSVVDGITRLATVRRLGRLPFFLAIGLPSETVFAQWRERAWVVGAAISGFAGVCVSLLVALLRQRGQRLKAEIAATLASDAAHASEKRLATYFDHLADGILVIRHRADGKLAYERVNTAAAGMLRMRARDAIGRRPTEIWPGPVGTQVEARWAECLADDGPRSYERTIEGPEGSRVLRLVFAPVRERGGEVTLLLGSMRDVTETVAMEAHLRQAQRMEAVGQLTAGVAHDFNNMLQAQLGALELLLDDVRDMPRARKHAELAFTVGRRGAALTHSLLSFSRRQHLAPEAVEVAALLERLKTILSRTLGPRIDLRVHAQLGMAAPFADAAQLESALLNLALNARDAMPEGGRVLMEARDASGFDTAPDGLVAGHSVVLCVSDSGTGMPPEVAARACEPFFTTKGVGKGSGLGLSMVQGFVQQSGGAIRIQTALGQGTVVELWLPRAAEAPHGGMAAAGARQADGLAVLAG